MSPDEGDGAGAGRLCLLRGKRGSSGSSFLSEFLGTGTPRGRCRDSLRKTPVNGALFLDPRPWFGSRLCSSASCFWSAAAFVRAAARSLSFWFSVCLSTAKRSTLAATLCSDDCR